MLNYIIKVIDSSRETDKLLLREFLKDLPSDGCVEYIRNLVGTSWHSDSFFSRINLICLSWDNVEHEFTDKRIEKEKKAFFKIVEDYINYVSLNTFVQRHNREWSEVAHEWKETNPKKYRDVIFEIPRKGVLIGDAYDEFVRLAKNRLNKPKFSWVIYAIIILLLPTIGSVITILVQKYL